MTVRVGDTVLVNNGQQYDGARAIPAFVTHVMSQDEIHVVALPLSGEPQPIRGVTRCKAKGAKEPGHNEFLERLAP